MHKIIVDNSNLFERKSVGISKPVETFFFCCFFFFVGEGGGEGEAQAY